MRDGSDKDNKPIRIVPVFPLPDTVLFPNTSLLLHIFEPRYRAMTRDVVRGERLIVVSLSKGTELNRIATVGRLREVEALDDGRFNLRLQGLERVSITEVAVDTPYRQVRVEPSPERVSAQDPSLIEQSKLELLATYGILRRVVQPEQTLVMHENLPFEVVVNTACACLPIEASLRQQLLAIDDLLDRQRLAGDYLSTIIDAMFQLKSTPQTGGSLLN